MIYGYVNNGKYLVITASENLADLIKFYSEVSKFSLMYEASRQPTQGEMKSSDEYEDFVHPPMIYEFLDGDGLLAFVRHYDIHIRTKNGAIDSQITMMRNTRKSMSVNSKKTIGEITGTNKEDPKPELTPQQAAHNKFLRDQARRNGMEDGSFASGLEPEPDGSVKVTEIEIEFDENGKPRIVAGNANRRGRSQEQHEAQIIEAERQVAKYGSIQKTDFKIFSTASIDVFGDGDMETVLVFVKKKRFLDSNQSATRMTEKELGSVITEDMTKFKEGVYLIQGKTEAEAKQMLLALGFYNDQTVAEVVNRDENVAQKPGRQLSSEHGAVFFRFDIKDTTLEALEPIWDISDRTFMDTAPGFGEDAGMVWFAFQRESIAKAFSRRLITKKIPISEVYSVDATNTRLIAANANAVSSSLEKVIKVFPRPWNKLSAEYEAMTEEEKVANRANYQGGEFLACLQRTKSMRELHVRITPVCYFDEHDEMYPDPLGIDHILPLFLKEIGPGLYSTTHDEAVVMFELYNALGFIDSFQFQMHINAL